MNKKIIYLSIFLILALFLVSACQKTVGDRLARIDPDECTDTDGGINYYVKGKINLVGPGEGSGGWDYCTDTYLLEWYCYDERSLSQSEYICPNGCKDGACIKEKPFREE